MRTHGDKKKYIYLRFPHRADKKILISPLHIFRFHFRFFYHILPFVFMSSRRNVPKIFFLHLKYKINSFTFFYFPLLHCGKLNLFLIQNVSFGTRLLLLLLLGCLRCQ